jgi:hypothetical protein
VGATPLYAATEVSATEGGYKLIIIISMIISNRGYSMTVPFSFVPKGH